MIRVIAVVGLLLLTACTEAALGLATAAVGVVVGAEQIVTAKEQQPPAPDVPQLDGSWIPP